MTRLDERMQNLMSEPPATLLPADETTQAAQAALTEAGQTDTDEAYLEVAGRYPTSSAAWAALATRALSAGQPVQAYAYARVGYHRGLDQLRRNGWKGHGPVPWAHQPNRGFLRCLYALSRAADQIGEADEAARCAGFLRDCDPMAADALSS